MKHNTASIGGCYLTVLRTPWRKAGPMFQPSWANEPKAPWRHGRGLLVRVLPFLAVAVGRWSPLEREKLGVADDGELGAVREDAAPQDEIEEWHRASLDRLSA